jgi:hypothetical protein
MLCLDVLLDLSRKYVLTCIPTIPDPVGEGLTSPHEAPLQAHQFTKCQKCQRARPAFIRLALLCENKILLYSILLHPQHQTISVLLEMLSKKTSFCGSCYTSIPSPQLEFRGIFRSIRPPFDSLISLRHPSDYLPANVDISVE